MQRAHIKLISFPAGYQNATLNKKRPSSHLKYSGHLDPIFSELYSSNSNGSSNLIGDGTFITTVEDFQRGKRGALQLGQIMKCATGCNPLAYKGYGCYCGFLGSGDYVDGIDK